VTHEMTTCPHESDVLDLIAIDQWPARADETLRAHVATCAVCGDLALVATALAGEARTPEEPVRVPDATVIWYGARLLARTDATRRAARPVLVAQGAALACVALIAVVGWQAFGASMLSWAGTLGPEMWPSWQDAADWLANSSARRRWLMAGLGVWALLVPLAFYLIRLADRGGETQAGRSQV